MWLSKNAIHRLLYCPFRRLGLSATSTIPTNLFKKLSANPSITRRARPTAYALISVCPCLRTGKRG